MTTRCMVGYRAELPNRYSPLCVASILNGSGRWPEGVDAGRMKGRYLSKRCRMLREGRRSLSARHPASTILHPECSAMAPNRKEIKPRRVAAAENAALWREAFVRYLRSECHLAENTVVAYDRDLRRFLEWLGARRIEGLAIGDLSGYPAWLTDQELAPASIGRHVVSLKVFFKYLQLEGIITENQAELLGTQKLWQRVPTVLSAAELDELLIAPRPPQPWWRRDRAMLEMLYATGCRVSELSMMRPRDLHLAEQYCICHGKGDKQRVVPARQESHRRGRAVFAA